MLSLLSQNFCGWLLHIYIWYICAHSIHYTYIYIIDIENTFLSHSFFHIFRRIGLKTDYHHFTSLDERIHGKMSHFDAIFDTICCLPASILCVRIDNVRFVSFLLVAGTLVLILLNSFWKLSGLLSCFHLPNCRHHFLLMVSFFRKNTICANNFYPTHSCDSCCQRLSLQLC